MGFAVDELLALIVALADLPNGCEGGMIERKRCSRVSGHMDIILQC